MSTPNNPKLEAVNDILEALGYDTVGDITVSDPDVVSAVRNIDRETRLVQSRPMWFNTTTSYLIPDSNSEIVLPQNTTSVHAIRQGTHAYSQGRYMRRGSKLYDTSEDTYTITQEVHAVLVVEQEYNDLPATVQEYITLRAIGKLLYNTDKSSQDYSVYKNEVRSALEEMNAQNINNGNSNMLRSPERTLNAMVGRLNNA